MRKLFITALLVLPCLCFAQTQYRAGDDLYSAHITKKPEKAPKTTGYTYRLKPVNVAVGSSMIGASLGAYAIGMASINDQMKNAENEDKVKSLKNTQATLGYICGGVSIVGAVVILLGLEKEYAPGRGVPLSNNLYFDNRNSGVSLAFSF